MAYLNKPAWKKWKYENGISYGSAVDIAQFLFFLGILRNLYLNNWRIYFGFKFDLIVIIILGILKLIYGLMATFNSNLIIKSLKEAKVKLSEEIKAKLKNYEKTLPDKIENPVEEKNIKKYKRLYKYNEIFNPANNKNIEYWKIVSLNLKKESKNKFVPIKKK